MTPQPIRPSPMQGETRMSFTRHLEVEVPEDAIDWLRVYASLPWWRRWLWQRDLSRWLP